MLDRGIGIAGIAFSVIFGILQFSDLQIPFWVGILGVGIGVLLFGISIGMMLVGQRNKNKLKFVDKAALRLHIFNDNRVPESLEMKNIFRWYSLSHIIQSVTPSAGKREIIFATLFIAFDPEVRVTTLKVNSPDMELPRFEVKQFNQKFAIISFLEKLNEGTLVIKVEP